jgi:hypothetical protein
VEPTVELADSPPMPVLDVVDKSDLTAVQAIYGDVPVLQIVWTDSGGRLPEPEDSRDAALSAACISDIATGAQASLTSLDRTGIMSAGWTACE